MYVFCTWVLAYVYMYVHMHIHKHSLSLLHSAAQCLAVRSLFAVFVVFPFFFWQFYKLKNFPIALPSDLGRYIEKHKFLAKFTFRFMP